MTNEHDTNKPDPRHEDDREPLVDLIESFDRALDASTLTPDGRDAARLLVDVVVGAMLNQDEHGLLGATKRLVEVDPDTHERVYTRRKGTVGLGGWARAVGGRAWRIQNSETETERRAAALFLILDLHRSDDRAGNLRVGTVIPILDDELAPGAPLTGKTVAAISARLACLCCAFDLKPDDRDKAYDRFRKHAP